MGNPPHSPRPPPPPLAPIFLQNRQIFYPHPLCKLEDIQLWSSFSSHNKNETRGFQKLEWKQRELLVQLNMKDNFMARYSHHCTFLEGVSFNHHESFQTSFSVWVQCSEPVGKIYLLSNLQSWNSLNYLT